MPENIPIPTIIAIVVAVVAVLAVILSGYVKAPPDQAYIISGLKKESKVLIGRAGIRVPIFERLDKLYLGQMSSPSPPATSSTSTWTPWPRSAFPPTPTASSWRPRTS